MDEETQTQALFNDHYTTLEKLYEAGWYIEHSSGGGWWFRNKETHERYAVPHWVRQCVAQALDCGMKSIKGQLKDILSGKSHYYGPCPPWTTDPKKKKSKQESPDD